MTCATSGTGTASGAPEFTPGFFYVVCVAQFLFFSSVLWIIVCSFVKNYLTLDLALYTINYIVYI